jgi:hypothetical protein
MNLDVSKLGIAFGAIAALAGVCSQLNSCLDAKVASAIEERSASKDDIARLEAKIDKVNDYLLHQSRK